MSSPALEEIPTLPPVHYQGLYTEVENMLDDCYAGQGESVSIFLYSNVEQLIQQQIIILRS